MDDREIIQLYIQKNERAIQETDTKYRRYLLKIAFNILGNHEDSEECVNDTYMQAWKSINDKSNYNLKMYLVRVLKNRALNMVRDKNAEKRGGGQYSLAIDELEDVLQSDDTPENRLIDKANAILIQEFLDTISELEADIFVRRYWFMDSIGDISRRYGITKVNTKVKLHRILKKLKTYVIENG